MVNAIGILTPFYPPHLGGMERALERLATGLERTGVSVTVHTSKIGVGHGHEPGTGSPRVRLLRHGETLASWSRDARAWASTASVDALLVASFGPDTRDETVQALSAARARGVRTVWRSPTADHAHRNLSGPNAAILDLVDTVVANSEASAERTAQAIGRRVEVIPNLLLNDELAAAALDAPAERTCDVAWVGRVAQRKRPAELAAALGALSDAGLSVHVQATHGYGERDLLERFRCALPSGVVVHLPSAVQPDIVRRAAVFLHLSDVEGSPNSVLEAAARGSFPVTSDIPECRELLVGTSGRTVAVGLDDLLNAVRTMVGLSTPLARLAQHKHFARRHAEGTVIPQWLSVLTG